MNNIYRKRIFLFIAMIIIFLGLVFIFLKEDKNSIAINNQNYETQVSNIPQEEVEYGAGYGMQVNKKNSKENSQKNGQITMKTPQDQLEVEFKNRGNSGKYILKVFYDYEEIKFKAGEKEEYSTSYIFELESMKSIKIPFKLQEEINNDRNSHKMTIGIYASPEKNAKTLKEMTNIFGATLDYELLFNKSGGKISLKQKKYKPMKLLDIEYQGLMINNDFKHSDKDAKYPPQSIKVSKGEKVKLAYRAGKYENVEDYLILSMLDWKQVKMDGKPYKLLNIGPSKMGYGTFYFTAPKKPGLYEFTSFIILDPTKNKSENNFALSESAYRFTIEVE